MKNKDIYDLGEQIKSMVESAVNTKDFQKLNQTVTNTINQAVSGVKKGMETYQQAVLSSRKKQIPNSKNPELIQQKPPGSVSGPLLTITGFSLGSMFGIAALGTLLPGIVINNLPLLVTGGVFAVIFAVGIVMGGRGLKYWRTVKRFRKYAQRLNDREFCKIEELAGLVGKKKSLVVKELDMMIQQGFFVQGHLDEQNRYLMLTDAVYEQYQNSQRELKRRQEMEAALPNEECCAIVREGNAYIRQIHQANEDIPGEVMSEKLERLEKIMIKIFRQVEKNPEVAQDLHRFMNYYLPTTMKLIEAYRELDLETLSGEHISATKKEIEDTLDTINTAFENLLDRFFKDTAWDISSDITVMKNMLEQEGLVGQSLQMTMPDQK